jgi:alpha-N-arabinofuranosidase
MILDSSLVSDYCQEHNNATNQVQVLAVWSGMALNHDVIPEDEIHLYVEDAMNELEFLMGSVDTTYGAWRAKVGHPEPWKIRYVEIGNEDNLNPVGKSSYESYRFKAFHDAIKAKYPDITVLASYLGMSLPAGAGSDYHTYDIPDNFVRNFGQFDNYPVENPILLGNDIQPQPIALTNT